MAGDGFCYRIHITANLPKVRSEGLKSYLPNQTEFGRKYQTIYRRWSDQIKEEGEDYRFYYAMGIRPSWSNRSWIRFPERLLDGLLKGIDTSEELYVSTGSESKRLVPPEEIEVWDETRNWIKLSEFSTDK